MQPRSRGNAEADAEKIYLKQSGRQRKRRNFEIRNDALNQVVDFILLLLLRLSESPRSYSFSKTNRPEWFIS